MAVYFIQRGTDGPVKIGFTASGVLKRRDNLQNGNAEWLYVLGVMDGDASVERALHARFKEARLIGEWFSPTEDLIALAATHYDPAYRVEPRAKPEPQVVEPQPKFVCDDALARRVIAAFGGPTKMTRAISHDYRVPLSVCHGWGRPGKGIPSWRYDIIISGAKRAQVTLPPEFVACAQASLGFRFAESEAA